MIMNKQIKGPGAQALEWLEVVISFKYNVFEQFIQVHAYLKRKQTELPSSAPLPKCQQLALRWSQS